MSSLTHSAFGQTFILLPQKAIFWLEEKALILGDLHFGKATHFRKNGIAINNEVAANDFLILENLLHETNPDTVYFIGDLFHSELNSELQLLQTIISKYKAIKFVLLKGNHDIIGNLVFEKIGIVVLEQIKIGKIILSHEPLENDKLFNIHGHVHPGILIKGKAKQSLKFPCFYFTKNYVILPAFSSFCGLKIMENRKAEAIFIIANNKIIKSK